MCGLATPCDGYLVVSIMRPSLMSSTSSLQYAPPLLQDTEHKLNSSPIDPSKGGQAPPETAVFVSFKGYALL